MKKIITVVAIIIAILFVALPILHIGGIHMAKAFYCGEDQFSDEEYAEQGVTHVSNFWSADEYYINLNGKTIQVDQSSAENYTEHCKRYEDLAEYHDTTYVKTVTNSGYIDFNISQDFFEKKAEENKQYLVEQGFSKKQAEDMVRIANMGGGINAWEVSIRLYDEDHELITNLK